MADAPAPSTFTVTVALASGAPNIATASAAADRNLDAFIAFLLDMFIGVLVALSSRIAVMRDEM
jgi:hypothetical protein